MIIFYKHILDFLCLTKFACALHMPAAKEIQQVDL